MGLKIAVASWDGEHITQHFGRAEQFLIYEIENGDYKCVETRLNQPGCNGRKHEVSLLEQSAELLSDCAVVLVSRIGPGAKALLDAYGILAMESPVFVDEALSRLISSKYFNNLISGETLNVKED
jgi:predicted Fe-Mo cluster-binding NifX family protein